MSLKEKLLKYDAKELIFVVEPHSDFTDEAKNIALDIIRNNKEYTYLIFWYTKYFDRNNMSQQMMFFSENTNTMMIVLVYDSQNA